MPGSPKMEELRKAALGPHVVEDSSGTASAYPSLKGIKLQVTKINVKPPEPPTEPQQPPKCEKKPEQPAESSQTEVLPSDYEKLQVMKAKTMYEMVEDIDLGNGHLKLLFLTNSQADSISSSSQTLHKMLEALEIQTPKLVINLLSSWGLRNSLNLFPANKYNLRMNPGVFHNSPPFLTRDDEQEALEKLDMFLGHMFSDVFCEFCICSFPYLSVFFHPSRMLVFASGRCPSACVAFDMFRYLLSVLRIPATGVDPTCLVSRFMSDVILPLAASTHALILANAIPGDCALSGALSRSYRLQRAKWGNPPPFTILSIAGRVSRPATSCNHFLLMLVILHVSLAHCHTTFHDALVQILVKGSTPRLYLNPNEGAHWHSLRRKSKSWTARHDTILETIQTPGLDNQTLCFYVQTC